MLFRAPNRLFDLDQPYHGPARTNAKRGNFRSAAYLSEVGSIMLIKTFALLVRISMAVHQVTALPSAGKRFEPVAGTLAPAMITQQIVNRSIKGDRLPIRQAKPQVNDNAPTQEPAQFRQNPKIKTDCKPPIDVVGRCFADVRVNPKVA